MLTGEVESFYKCINFHLSEAVCFTRPNSRGHHPRTTPYIKLRNIHSFVDFIVYLHVCSTFTVMSDKPCIILRTFSRIFIFRDKNWPHMLTQPEN